VARAVEVEHDLDATLARLAANVRRARDHRRVHSLRLDVSPG
jgi:hypothetical protein